MQGGNLIYRYYWMGNYIKDLSTYDVIITVGYKKGTITLVQNQRKVKSVRIWPRTRYEKELMARIRQIGDCWETPMKIFKDDGKYVFASDYTVKHCLIHFSDFFAIISDLIYDLPTRSSVWLMRRIRELLDIN